jgi:hypothetical protein
MSMILLEPAYKISRSEIKRRTISVSPISGQCEAPPTIEIKLLPPVHFTSEYVHLEPGTPGKGAS